MHSDGFRTPSPRAIGPNIDEGLSVEVESISIPASKERSYDAQELITTSGNQWGSSSPEHNMHTLATQGGNHVVAQCVDLLQRDPNVQVWFPCGIAGFTRREFLQALALNVYPKL